MWLVRCEQKTCSIDCEVLVMLKIWTTVKTFFLFRNKSNCCIWPFFLSNKARYRCRHSKAQAAMVQITTKYNNNSNKNKCWLLIENISRDKQMSCPHVWFSLFRLATLTPQSVRFCEPCHEIFKCHDQNPIQFTRRSQTVQLFFCVIQHYSYWYEIQWE